MKNLITRSLSGIVYIAVIVGAILAGWQWVMILTGVFAVIGVAEFESLTIPSTRRSSLSMGALWLDIFGALSLCLIPLGLMSQYWDMTNALMCPLVYFVLRVFLAICDKGETAFRNTIRSFMAVIYIGLPLASLNMLYISGFEEAHMLVLAIFIMIWLNDTGAFCVGSTLGKHRLCERLSPKKSWEGFWGGLAFCVAFGVACYLWWNTAALGMAAWIGLGVVVSICATVGDLFESMLKRSVGAKDSGKIIPGHGGILDRIDSLLLVAPASLLFLMIAG